MCPLVVAALCGGYFLSDCSVNPGKSEMKPFLTASLSVARVGENKQACAYATRSSGDADGTVAS